MTGPDYMKHGRAVRLTPRIPCATYRLQFNEAFRFSDAREAVPYLYDLGITDIYASPYFMAKKGSLHGYDIVDPSRLNPGIGTEEEYDEFVHELNHREMGQILDIVPNHMCVAAGNAWWMDVLENGPSSAYADFFDIDWDPLKAELHNRILLPILGSQYGEVLENQELKLSFERGSFYMTYYDNKLPIRPRSGIAVLACGLDSLTRLLPAGSESLAEYLSIITALRNLPLYTETGKELVIERNRETAVAKKRLAALYDSVPEIRTFIDMNIVLFNGVKGQHGSFDLLDALLSEQAYRLSHWAVATEEINYRRFFDINSLAAIKIENLPVFEAVHRSLFKLIREGKVTGLRVDHPDGLYDPLQYFRRLQRACFANSMLGHVDEVERNIDLAYGDSFIEKEISNRYDEALSEDPGFKPFYIVGEKILIKSERMPEEWPIFSTTGYVFLNSLNGIFVETRNARQFSQIHRLFTRDARPYEDWAYYSKKLIMEVAMAGEINTLGNYLNRISERNRHTRDFTLNSLTRAIKEVIAFFPVYRTYISSGKVEDRDLRHIEQAVTKAKRKNPALNGSVFDFLRDVLSLNRLNSVEDSQLRERLDFVMRFQQVTGPVMAKGLEDTAFYAFTRLLSLNEVGGSPDRFGTSLETFHGQNIERSKFWPHALIATTTHDSKRSEDARARINVLSEIPRAWKERLAAWKKLNRTKKIEIDGRLAPGPNEEYYLYQTLVAAWPTVVMDDEAYHGFIGRIKDHFRKALREAKISSSWINPDNLYEEGSMVFIDAITARSPDNVFLQDFVAFQETISGYGMYNSLSQTLLKITAPGVPDFYQGSELWDFRLADPDNRGPVDYGVRSGSLREIKARMENDPLAVISQDLLLRKRDGRIKLFLIFRALNFRKTNRQLFEKGEYRFLHIAGEKADNVCAFSRRLGNSSVIVACPRFFTRLLERPDDLPVGEKVWGSSAVAVPSDGAGVRYRNVFTDETVTTGDVDGMVGLSCAEIFRNFPVSLLVKVEDYKL